MRRPPSDDVPLFSTRSIEGEYTAWNYVWTRDYGAAVSLGDLLVDNYGTVYVQDWAPPDVYVRTFLGVETFIANYDFLMWTLRPTMSATGKYIVGWTIGAPWTVFDVWRYGVIIFSRDISADDPNAIYLYPWAISPNGKFVAIIADAAGAPGSLLMLYEGV